MSYELREALRILARVHTRDNDRHGFIITTGVSHTDRQDYADAWKVVRQALELQVEPRS